MFRVILCQEVYCRFLFTFFVVLFLDFVNFWPQSYQIRTVYKQIYLNLSLIGIILKKKKKKIRSIWLIDGIQTDLFDP